MEEKIGIEETKKFLDCLTKNVIDLMKIDYQKIYSELSDIDDEERKEIMIEIAEVVLEILYSMKGSSLIGLSAVLGKLK